jgi:hypothetical protein
MKKIIAFFLLLVIAMAVFARQHPLPDTSKVTTPIVPVSNKGTSVRYMLMVEGCSLWGLGANGQSNYGVTVINGIRLPHYSIGIGLGVRIYTDSENTTQINRWESEEMSFDRMGTAYLENRIYFLNKKIKPYIALGLGCVFVYSAGVMLDTKKYASFLLNSSAGISWVFLPRTSLNLGIVFEQYKIRYDTKNAINNTQKHFEELSNSLGVTLGFSFTLP